MQKHNESGAATPVPEAGDKPGFFTRVKTRFNTMLRSHAGKEALPTVAMALLGFLFARTPLFFGAYPLALALLVGSRHGTIPVFLGALAGAATIGMRGFVYAVVYLVALLIRLLFSLPGVRLHALPDSREVFCELPQMQVVTAAVMSVATAVYELAVSGFTAGSVGFSLSMILATTALTGAFTCLFSYGIRMENILGSPTARAIPHGKWETIRAEFGLVCVLFLASYSLREYALFGIHFSYLFSGMVTLFVSRRFGALRGCVLGLLVGFGGGVVYAPAFGLAGLISGVLWPLGSVYSLLLGSAAGIGWCAYVGGLTGFLTVGPELAVAALISLPILPRLYSDAIAGEVKQARSAAEEAVRLVAERDEGENRVTRLSSAFDALAKTFSERALAPDPARCFRACDEICTGYCEHCGNRVACWDSQERPGERALRLLARRVASGETIVAEELPTVLLTDCPHLDELLSAVRLAGANLWKEQRRAAGADYPAPDYALTAELLREAGDATGEDRHFDFALAAKIRRLLADKGIRPAAVTVRGGRRKSIYMGSAAFSGKQREAAALLPEIADLAGCKLSPARFESTEEVITMTCHTVPRYTLEVAYATRPVTGEEVSGDCVSVFGSPEGYSYLLLSDGMGTGRAAARTAGVCALFLEKMLSAGNSKETSLKMLNHLVSIREEESSATVDLLEFDTCYGHATFLKSGAASSYVRREGNLFRLRSRTIPIGLVREVDAEKLKFDTREGDLIIMLSDGISQTSEDAPWLIELLSKPMGASLENAANTILEKTVQNIGCHDDMTVVVARVTAAG